jgi:hypothetical protein
MASPARLDYARDFAFERHQAQTNPAQLEVAVIAARAAADLASIPVSDGEFGSSIQFRE